MALELLSLLCTFENSKKCDEISFDPESFLGLVYMGKNASPARPGLTSEVNFSDCLYEIFSPHLAAPGLTGEVE